MSASRADRTALLTGVIAAALVAGCVPVDDSAGGAASRDGAVRSAPVDDAGRTSGGPTGTSSPGDAATSTGGGPAATAPAAAPQALWQHDGEMLSRPVRVGGTVLAHVGSGTGHDAALVALDAEDGTQLWSVPVDLTLVSSIDAPAVVDDTVVTFQDGPGESVHVVAVDPVDGSEVARSAEPFTAYLLPSTCGLEDGTACLRGFRAGETTQDYARWQVTIDGGEVAFTAPPEAESETEVRSGDLTVELTTGLPDDPAVFRAERDGQVLWEVPASERGLHLAGLTGRAGSYGTQAGTYVHDVLYVDLETSMREEARVPLADHRLLALDAETGEELWSRAATTQCSGNGEVPDVIVTCSGEGEVVLAPWPGGATFEAQDVVMRGVERRTGTTLWEREISADDWTALEGLPGPVGAGQVLVQVDGRRQLVDVRTGEVMPEGSVPAGGFICSGQRDWGRTGEDADGEVRRADHLAYPCSVAGDPRPAASATALERVADEAGDLLLVTAPGSLSAYPSGD